MFGNINTVIALQTGSYPVMTGARRNNLIKFTHIIISVSDLNKAKEFYCNCLELPLSKDLEVCFTLEGDAIMIHDAKIFSGNIFKNIQDAYLKRQGVGNVNVYFETNELERLYRKVLNDGYTIIHPIEMQPWNQNVFRVYDPDGHIVEVGEPLWLKM
jgi:catechol 2,3-dioxygenase-like lactoylglutathione lyase family enzyme